MCDSYGNGFTGADATTAFYDIGHSEEAVAKRETFLIGSLKVPSTQPPPTKKPAVTPTSVTQP